jgi:hypothetical protein
MAAASNAGDARIEGKSTGGVSRETTDVLEEDQRAGLFHVKQTLV